MVYRLIAKLYPKKVLANYEHLLEYANIKTDAKKFVGFTLVFGFFLGWGIAFWLGLLTQWNALFIFPITFISFEVFIYVWLLFSVENKAKFIEKVLPDALQLMSSNLRAGFTPDRALLLAARPEFGPFTEEINVVGKEITVGKNIEDSLMDMSKRIKSEKFEKTINLIVSGLKSGGELASLLEQTSKNLRQQEFFEEKARSSIGMYVIFIFAAIGFAAPLLYGLSSFLVDVLTSILGNIETPTASTIDVPLSISEISVDPAFIRNYILISLSGISLMGSMVLGLINHGKEKEGLKTFPVLLAMSIIVFLTVRFLIGLMLGSLFEF